MVTTVHKRHGVCASFVNVIMALSTRMQCTLQRGDMDAVFRVVKKLASVRKHVSPALQSTHLAMALVFLVARNNITLLQLVLPLVDSLQALTKALAYARFQGRWRHVKAIFNRLEALDLRQEVEQMLGSATFCDKPTPEAECVAKMRTMTLLAVQMIDWSTERINATLLIDTLRKSRLHPLCSTRDGVSLVRLLVFAVGQLRSDDVWARAHAYLEVLVKAMRIVNARATPSERHALDEQVMESTQDIHNLLACHGVHCGAYIIRLLEEHATHIDEMLLMTAAKMAGQTHKETRSCILRCLCVLVSRVPSISLRRIAVREMIEYTSATHLLFAFYEAHQRFGLPLSAIEQLANLVPEPIVSLDNDVVAFYRQTLTSVSASFILCLAHSLTVMPHALWHMVRSCSRDANDIRRLLEAGVPIDTDVADLLRKHRSMSAATLDAIEKACANGGTHPDASGSLHAPSVADWYATIQAVIVGNVPDEMTPCHCKRPRCDTDDAVERLPAAKRPRFDI